MASPRSPRPLVRTYVTTSTKKGKPVVHARVYSKKHHLDVRGTGATAAEARERALEGLKKPK